MVAKQQNSIKTKFTSFVVTDGHVFLYFKEHLPSRVGHQISEAKCFLIKQSNKTQYNSFRCVVFSGTGAILRITQTVQKNTSPLGIVCKIGGNIVFDRKVISAAACFHLLSYNSPIISIFLLFLIISIIIFFTPFGNF